MNGLVSEILNILGVDFTFEVSEELPCVLDTRTTKDGGSQATASQQVLYLDDFIQLDRSIQALQGRGRPGSGAFSEPDLSSGIMALDQEIRRVFEGKGLSLPSKPFWPDGAPAALVLTHDVDWFTYSPLHRAVIKETTPSKFLRSLFHYLSGRPYGNNVASIVDLESRHGVKSTFLFRNTYADGQGELRAAVSLCKESGCEVALHAARGSHRDSAAMIREKEAMEEFIGTRVLGLREHALKFDQERTWRCIEEGRFTYDMTRGVNEKWGFVDGLCHPFHPLRADGTRYSFVEIPTCLMDWSIIHAGLRYDELKSEIDRLKERVLRLRGCMCVNFHNTYIDPEVFPDVERAYKYLIMECKAAGFWVATAGECARWWESRGSSLFHGFTEAPHDRSPIEAPNPLSPSGVQTPPRKS